MRLSSGRKAPTSGKANDYTYEISPKLCQKKGERNRYNILQQKSQKRAQVTHGAPSSAIAL